MKLLHLFIITLLLSCAAAAYAISGTATLTVTSTGAISFISRSQNSANASSATVTVPVPAGTQTGDLVVLLAASFNSPVPLPSGWQSAVQSVNNAHGDWAVAGWKLYNTSDGSSYTFGPVGYPKAILRTYRGANSIDASVGAHNTAVTSLTIAALSATASASEEYVGFWANETAGGVITGPTGLANSIADQSQWATWEGDQFIASSDVVPGALTASAGSTNWIGIGLTLSASAPTPTPTPTATPTPNGFTVDALANATTVKEYRFLQSLMNAGGTNHLVQGEFDVVRNCTNNDCSTEQSTNFSANGGKWMGNSGVDFCNGFWGDPNTPPCVFGAGSDAYQQAVSAWNRGQIVTLGMHFPNVYNNWQNQSANSLGLPAHGQPCGGGSQVPSGVSYDCSGMTDAFVTSMLTTGTTDNAHWNSLLDNFTTTDAALQSQGITVIAKVMHEYTACTNGLWWGCLSPGVQQNLFHYIQNYFNTTKGLHNVLWTMPSLDGGPGSGFVGPQYVDLTGEDSYVAWNQFTVMPGYATYAAMGKPVYIAEYDCGGNTLACRQVTNYYNYVQALHANMPAVVLDEWWWGTNPGGLGNTTWSSVVNDTYGLMAPDMPAH